MKKFPKYSFGVGDRFGRQGASQLEAFIRAKEQGVVIAPVWNKSYREHTIVGSSPSDVREEADEAVRSCGWEAPYFVDADHVGLSSVDMFIESSDFFTLDVAEQIGSPAEKSDTDEFVASLNRYRGNLDVPGVDGGITITEEDIVRAADKFLLGIKEAGKICRHIEQSTGEGSFVCEVSMDETDSPQSPAEMLLILAGIAEEKIPAQTVAPKFIGEFHKGVDYIGDVQRFSNDFRGMLGVIKFAVNEFGLPSDLKLSIHSGSDKFSIYGPIRDALREFDAGLHLKTAGTTWLEELNGLILSGGSGLDIAREIYSASLNRFDELCEPYATVVDIDSTRLLSEEDVSSMGSEELSAVLTHDLSRDSYNPHVRQLLHVAYKIAAEMGDRYLKALEDNSSVIGENVTKNILERHIRPLFLES